MALERRQVAAAQQVLDQGIGTATGVSAGNIGQVQALGTIWPLLPNTVCRIWNASIQGVPANSGKIAVVSMNIIAALLDASGNSLNNANIMLAAWNSTGNRGSANQNTLGPDGAALAVNGDPLIELVSGLLIAGQAVTGAGVAAVQIQAFADVFNADSGSQNFTVTMAALLSFVPRSS